MNEILAFLRQLISNFRPWATINPWEKAVRVRGGKKKKTLGPGIHFKFPFLDAVFVQSVRLRVAQITRQTVSTSDGATISISGAISYAIEDIDRLYDSLHHAEQSITIMAKVAIANFVTTHARSECSAEAIIEAINKSVDLSEFGLSQASISLTDFCIVKTYRIVGDTNDYFWGDTLQTHRSTDQPA